MSQRALEISKATPPENPARLSGRLRSEVSLTLHSGYAKSLIRGRPASPGKPAIIGLLGFADRLRVIWHAARRDDPYADWWLIRLDPVLEQMLEKLRDEQRALAVQWQSWSTLEIDVAESDVPFTMPLRFSNPYAYRAAEMVGEFDLTVRMLLTARHVGHLKSQIVEKILKDCSSAVRRVFTMSTGYRGLGLDRATLRGDASVRKRAESMMGKLPTEILAGERRPELAPPPRTVTTVSESETQDACHS